MNEFTEEDIKNSIEYRWRMFHCHFILIIFGLMSILCIVFPFFVIMGKNLDALSDRDLVDSLYFGFVISELIFAVILIPCALFYYGKARIFLRNYKKYPVYEVMLDSPSTSYMYRGSLYYTVKIVKDDGTISVDTNPYFSTLLFSKFDVKDFNNKNVIGLYDEEREKFYLIKEK